MKTALLHYWLINNRGGEKVLREIAMMYPRADIFTHAYNPRRADPFWKERQIFETFIARLPRGRKNCQRYLPLMPLALKQIDLDAYDLIISSESGPVKGIRKNPGSRHICYCHTPMRYLWDMYEAYHARASWTEKIAMTLFCSPLRKYDLRSAECVDAFIANSHFVAARIKRIYGRGSVVIHPPVDYEFFSGVPEKNGDYYLLAGELAAYKNPFLAVETCRKMGRKLIVAGAGKLERELRKHAGKDVLFTGRVPDETLRQLYAGARALLFPGIEDFGIIPLEAQAAGTPVIALGEGGVLETVISGETGVFFQRADVDSMAGAIETFESLTFDPQMCRRNAARFRKEIFREQFQNFINGNGPQA